MTEPVRELDSPYVGLAPFESEHADYFFGRSLDSSVLADNVLARPITVLYGASGVGKSSVLNVGLPRALSELGVTARMVSRSRWYEPGALAEWLHEAASPASMAPPQPVVVILDQFEEYFLYADADQIKAFARSLAKVVSRTDLETHLLFALRDDGLHRLDALRLDLPTLLDTTLELRHLDESSVREAIELPIAAWNERHSQPVALDTGFAASLIAQLRPKNLEGQPVKDGRIELAYLQLALERIWEAEGGASATALRTSTLTERLKGVSEIARRHVEEVLGELKEEDQALCATVFDRLVTPSGGKIAYATADLAAVAKVPPDRMDAVLSPLASGKSRILRAVTTPGRLHSRGYEILHDILARPILEWREQRATKLERERADVEALARQRLERLSNRLAIAVVVLLLMAATAAWFGWRASRAERTVDEITLRGHSLRLVADGQALLSTGRNDERALLELLAAFRIAATPETESALLVAMLARRDLVKSISTGDSISAVAFSPDGRRIASDGAGDTLRIWDAQTGKPVGAPLYGHQGAVLSVAFSPDGRRLVSGSSDNTLRLWDAETGQPIGVPLIGHRGAVSDVAFSPDGRRIVSGSADATLRLWDAQTGQPTAPPFAGHQISVNSVAFSPDARRIVSGSSDNTLRLWDAQTGQPIGAPFIGHRDNVWTVAFSPDGRRIVSAGGDDTLRLWDAQTGQPASAPLTGHQGVVRTVAFSPDGRRIVSGSGDDTLRLWDAQTGQPIGAPLTGHQGIVNDVDFSPDGLSLVSGSADNTLRLWNVQTGQSIGALLARHQDAVRSVAFSADGRRIVSASRDEPLRLWNAETGQPIGGPLTGHRGGVRSVAFDPESRRVVSGGSDLRLWNAETGDPIGTPLIGHEGAVLSVAFSPDGRRIASGSIDESLRLWDAQTGQPIGEPLKPHQAYVNSVAFSPDGRRLVSGGGTTVRLWNAATATLQPIDAPLNGHQGEVTCVAFSPDGRHIISGGSDATLRLWDAQTGHPIDTQFKGHQDAVLSVAFSPDGRHVVSGSRDNTLRLWNAQTGQPIGPPFNVHQGAVRSVAFSPGARQILSGGGDGALRLTPGPSAWLGELCSKLTRNLFMMEWREWVSPDIDYVTQCPDLPIPADTPEGAPGKEP